MDESRNVREKQFSLSRALSFCTIDANIAVTRSIFIGLSRAWQARGIQGSGEIRYSRWLCDPLIHCLDEASSGSPPGGIWRRRFGKKANSNLTNEKVSRRPRVAAS